MRRRLILVLTLALGVVIIGTALTYAEGRGFRGARANLTDEQRTAIRELVETEKEAGSTREEIHTAVGVMLNGFGVELPEDWGQRLGRNQSSFRGPFANLTEEQRAAIRETIKTMRESGATHEEIRAAVLAEHGVELPEKSGPRHRRGRFGLRGLGDELTDEERAEIRATVKEMRESGATREAIRAAVAEMLEGFGIERPEDPDTETVSKTALTSTSVSQNMPNPFNPITTIAYDLSEPANVTLRVYALTGQEVATLVSAYQQPGHYEATWDGSGFANGMYLYRLEAGPYTATKRMLLLK